MFLIPGIVSAIKSNNDHKARVNADRAHKQFLRDTYSAKHPGLSDDDLQSIHTYKTQQEENNKQERLHNMAMSEIAPSENNQTPTQNIENNNQ
jgi:hypothetical protein